MIILDYQDRRPIYEQITERFRTLIYQGALPAGSRLPSVRQLAMELSINPNTIRGKGNFVAETTQIQEKSREDFREEFLELVKKGLQTGVTEEEMLSLVRKSCEEEQR